jgi:hypothetical protein
MEKILLKDIYPVFVESIAKSETDFKNVDDIVSYYKELIDAHPITSFIAIFDNYTHTSNLKEHVIAANIKDAKNIIYCYGKSLDKIEVTGIRPRSFGIVETDYDFVISFMEAPDPIANNEMIEWTKGIKLFKNRQTRPRNQN